MSDIFTTRRENLRKLIAGWPGTLDAFAKQVGYANVAFLSQMTGPNPTREVTERTARKIESSLGLPSGMLDTEDETPSITAKPLDKVLLSEVLHVTAEEVEKSGTKLPYVKVADIATLAFSDAETNGKVRIDYIRQLIALVK